MEISNNVFQIPNISNASLEMQHPLDNSSQIISLNSNSSQLKRIYLKPNLNDPNSNILLKSRLSFSTKNLNIISLNNAEPLSTASNTNPSATAISLIHKPANKLLTAPNLNSLPKSTLSSSDDSLLMNDEFDSPLNMKDNILTSMRRLKPSLVGLDVLRSSTSDEDEGVNETNNQVDTNDNKKTKLSQLLTGAITQCDSKTTFPKPKTQNLLIINDHSDLIKKTNKVTNKVNRSYYISSKNSNDKINNSPTPTKINVQTYNNNPIIMKQSCKRGKEEALSNSSSSDEDDSQQTNQNEYSILTDKNEHAKTQSVVKTTPISIRPSMTSESQDSYPVLTTITFSSNKSNSNNANNILTQAIIDRTSDASKDSMNNIQSVMKACKSDHDYNGKYSRETLAHQQINDSPIFSSASSTASYSSITSVTSPSNTNETIDFLDDNSSTASGPIYVRQPGFDHHAHEFTLGDFNNAATDKFLSSVEIKKIKSINDDCKKINNKAKKKLCLPSSVSSITTSNISLTNESLSKKNIQLKPIKSKREPIPMRLRALPSSFWQQPNQSNISPGTMYLPPLFKNDGESSETSSDIEYKTSFEQGTKDVKMSPANTDLLFKLFENVESKDKKLLQLNQPNASEQRKEKLIRKTSNPYSKALLKGEDPCIIDAVSEGLFPLLSLESRHETLQFPSIKNDYCTSNGLSNSSPLLTNNSLLPSLQVEQNYYQALSEVVAAL